VAPDGPDDATSHHGQGGSCRGCDRNIKQAAEVTLNMKTGCVRTGDLRAHSADAGIIANEEQDAAEAEQRAHRVFTHVWNFFDHTNMTKVSFRQTGYLLDMSGGRVKDAVLHLADLGVIEIVAQHRRGIVDVKLVRLITKQPLAAERHWHSTHTPGQPVEGSLISLVQ
jgi:hypothetical protein